ncbi:MAG: hypothetical protein WC356_00015 [Candidatus Micrarchaeia archaeon]|jgi:flagellar basal body-associated protein FliL
MVNKKKTEDSDATKNSKFKKDHFVFNIRKKFSNSKHLSVKKKYEKDSNNSFSFLKSKKTEGVKSTIISKKIIFIGLFILILAAIIFVVLSSSSQTQQKEKEPVNPYLHFSIYEKNTDIVSYGQNELVAYFIIDYQIENANSLKAKIDVYRDLDSKTVYLLKSEKYEPRSSEFENFKEALRDKLIKEGYTFNEKTKEELFNLPESSIILIPTGHIPRDLIIGDKTLIDLIEKKNVIIYIGYPFNQALDYDGTLISIEDQNTLNFNFILNEALKQGDKLVSSGLNLQSPRYKVTYQRVESDILFGAVSSFKIGEGFILFIPQYLDDGWVNGTLAAEDITKIISQSSWHKPITSKEINLSTNSDTISLFSNPFKENANYVKIKFIAEGENEGLTNQVEVSKISKSTLGTISVDTWPIHSYKITKNNIFMLFTFKEQDKVNINPNMLIYSGNTLLKSENLGSTFSDIVISRSFSPDFEPGNYLITIEEGKTYAKYLLDIKDIKIDEVLRSDFNKGNFKFRIVDENGNQVRYDSVKVSINGKEVGVFNKGEEIALTNYQGLPNGENTFTFDFGEGVLKEIKIKNNATNPFMQIIENPLNLSLLIITIIAVIIAFYVKRPEKQMFSLDIPDFPPVSSTKVTMKEKDVLDIFEKVNKNYSWNFMPLSLEELKTGFSKISIRGRNIIIGEYNLELLLDKLIVRGLVKERHHYYILSSWEKESGNELEHLVMFRRLRNIFLENVISFTDLNKSKDCDVFIEVSGEKVYLHIFSDKNIIFKALKTVIKGQTIILFDSKNQMKEFENDLASSNPSIVSFKLELSNGNIFLYTLEDLVKFIKIAKAR